jgi:hypothetical protein
MRDTPESWAGVYEYKGFIRYVDIQVCSLVSDRLFTQWETRLLSLDPVTIAHILKNSTIFEKPPQARTIVAELIGCGIFASEGIVHKRQRRVATPAFSVQNMRALVPLVFKKGEELKDRWMGLIQEQAIDNSQKHSPGIRLDVCRWISRATFDVMGLAGQCLSLLVSTISLRCRSCCVQDSITISMPFKTNMMSCLTRTKICLRWCFPRLGSYDIQSIPTFRYSSVTS